MTKLQPIANTFTIMTILSFLLIFSGVHCKKPDFKDRYVGAKDGLILRSEPKASSKKIAVIPFDTKLKIDINAEAKAEAIGSMTGSWRPVRISDDQQGWVYDGFLTEKSAADRGEPEAIEKQRAAALSAMRASGGSLEVDTHCIVPMSCALTDGCSKEGDCLHGSGKQYSFELSTNETGWQLTISRPGDRKCVGSLEPLISSWLKTPWSYGTYGIDCKETQ